jgi:hypothetical protein
MGARSSRRTTIAGRGMGPWRILMIAAVVALASDLLVASENLSQAKIRISHGNLLRPGQLVSVDWTALPPRAEEFELLLRCEDPVAVTIRLTECEDASLEGLSWRVPNFPVDRARLLLRCGDGEREILWAQSEPFRIASRADSPLPCVMFMGEEYWISEETAPKSISSDEDRIHFAPEHRSDPLEGTTPPSTSALRGGPPGVRPAKPRPLRGTIEPGPRSLLILTTQIRI